jgi:PBP1b-binding outer membrane lipoprotein LpoB
MKKQLAIGSITLALLLSGCSASTGTTENSAPPVEQKTDSVQWEDYGSTLKADIDALAASKDCNGLQEQFNNADANNTATMTRTGHNNAELMGYLDEALKTAGCY